MNIDLRLKIVLVGCLGFLFLATLLTVLDFRQARHQAKELYVEKARSVVLAAESAREEMAHKWDQGLFSKEELRDWADRGEMDKVLAAVPVVTAWRTSMAKSAEGNYTFKVPKFHPRNPDNQPDELEARVLPLFEEAGLAEHVVVDRQLNAIRYFRPIRLTAECLLCHGDPASSQDLWGNDRGLDPTGGTMENWQVGEVHGAFEVVQSLDQLDAMVRAAMLKKILMTLLLLVAGSAAFYWVVTRQVVKPVERIIEALGANSNEVSSASIHVADSSTRMAEGAMNQAENLQDISNTLGHLTDLTRNNSDLAGQVSRESQETMGAARTGQDTMQRMGQAIQRIKESSDQTTGIIKTIDEIAFQTNLLALNAAVEAARAGDAGKGFAVVAEEVRNLAQRSAEAARNTNALLEESAQHANQGVAVAAEVSALLEEIVQKVTEVADLADRVNSASATQAGNIGQISQAVRDVDEVTQGNAASAEESAAASEELSAQAGILDGLVRNLNDIVAGQASSDDREPSSAGCPPKAGPRHFGTKGSRQVHTLTDEEMDLLEV